jgi:hypothetical protein
VDEARGAEGEGAGRDAPAKPEPTGRARFQDAPIVVAALLCALPVLLAYYPPMTDFPHHEALVALLRTYGDRARWPEGMYLYNFGEPNQLFHLLAWPLSYLFSITFACKLVTAASMAAIPLGARALARHFGASPWLSLALVPFALGWLADWGLINNLMGLGILLALLPQADRFVARPTAKGALAVAGAIVGLYLAHELMLFVYVGALMVFTALQPLRPWKRVLARLGPIVFSVAVVYGQLQWQKRFMGPNDVARVTAWTPRLWKLLQIPTHTVGLSEELPRNAVFGLWVLLFALVAATRASQRATSPRAPYDDALPDDAEVVSGFGRLQRRLLPFRFEILALGSLFLYFTVPLSINGGYFIFQRFLHPALAIGLLAAGARVAQRTKLAVHGLAGAIAASMLLVAWPLYAESSQNARDVEALVERIPMQPSVALVELDAPFRERPFVPGSSLSRVLTMRGGRVFFSFAESSVAPVALARKHYWGDPSVRMHNDHLRFIPAYDFHLFKYLLVHVSEPTMHPLLRAGLAPEGRLIATAGEWALYESTLDVIPITAAPPSLPTPAPPDLRKRIERLFRASKQQRAEESAPGGARERGPTP